MTSESLRIIEKLLGEVKSLSSFRDETKIVLNDIGFAQIRNGHELKKEMVDRDKTMGKAIEDLQSKFRQSEISTQNSTRKSKKDNLEGMLIDLKKELEISTSKQISAQIKAIYGSTPVGNK